MAGIGGKLLKCFHTDSTIMAERRLAANVSTIGKIGQREIASSCVGVAGLGGVGGIAFELIVRAGVGRIKIADIGFFEESNANRQSLWSKASDGRKKTEVAEEFAASVNERCKISKFGEIKAANAVSFAKNCTAIIDATDRAHSRLAVWRGCKKAGVPYIFASALGARGMLSVFRGRKDFEKEFNIKRDAKSSFFSCGSQDAAESHGVGQRAFSHRAAPCDHSLGPVANAMGCLAAQQAMNIILGKRAAEFPEIISIDAFSTRQVSLHSFR